MFERDEKKLKKVKQALENINNLSEDEVKDFICQLQTVTFAGLGCINIFGTSGAMAILSSFAITPVATYCKMKVTLFTFLGAAFFAGLNPIDTTVNNPVVRAIVDDVAENVDGFMSPMIRREMKRAAEKAAEVAKNKTGTDVIDEATKKGIREATQKAIDDAVKTWSNVGRGLTAVVGLVSAAWDLFGLIEAYDKSQPGTRSELGDELRKIANQMEEDLQRNFRQG